jgi:hypothetical protein
VVAVDWSGAKSGAGRRICLAEVVDGRLQRLEGGRDRTALVRHLVSEAERDPDRVVGLDFAFSFPRWYLADQGVGSIDALWALAEAEGEEWLAECAPPFWGRPGRRRPDHQGYRRTELEIGDRFPAQPKSAFQIGGAGAVGTMSVRGMPYLAKLREAGFSIWPFDAPRLPMVVEIYPRLLTGGLVKSDPAARAGHLQDGYPELDGLARERAAASEHALDAAVSAVVMARHVGELLALEPARDEIDALEGRIWVPRPVGPTAA